MSLPLSANRISERKSNFELLRIIAMVMIVASHFYCHGILHILDSDIAYQAWNNGTKFNKFIASFFGPGGETGVALFFMLTGYFLVDKMRTSVLKVFLETAFYNVVIYAVILVIYIVGKLSPFFYPTAGIKNIVGHLLLPISKSDWWFVTPYILLVLVAPIINQFLRTLNKKGFFAFLCFSWFFWYVFQYVFESGYVSFARAFFFYVLGAYLRKDENCHFRLSLLVSFAVILWLAIAFLPISEFMASDGIFAISFVRKFLDLVSANLRSCVFVPMISACIFSIFARLDIKQNRFLNTVAATTFGIYLIHDSKYGRDFIWNAILKVSDVQFLSPYFPLFAIADIAGVFIICSLIDYFRLRFIEPKLLAKAKNLILRLKTKYCDL